MSEVIKIYGPPGTGKTSTLISKLREEIQNDDLSLKDVVFISFSNSAINEVCERVGILRGSRVAPYFRTLHGLCLKNLIKTGKISPDLIRRMQSKGFVEGLQERFCREEGIPFERDDGFGASDALGNRVFTAWNAVIGEFYPESRDIGKCLEMLYNINYNYGSIIERWLNFKENAGFFDYVDLLIESFEEGIEIEAKIGFIDEAQDFNRLEFEIVETTIEQLERVYLAGDDDQAIYGWKGAKPDFYLDLKGEEVILSKTHRLPSRVWNFAKQIITQVERRKEKEIEPREDAGVVRILPKMDIREFLSCAVGTARRHPNLKVFVLFRTNRMVYQAESILLENAIPFKRLKGFTFWDKEFVTAWNIVAKLRRKEKLNLDELKFLVENANPDIISEEQKEILTNLIQSGNIPITLFEALHKLPILDLIALRRKRAKKLLEKAWKPIDFEKINLYIDTIHASKGAEADIVFLADAITSPIVSAINNGHRDDELRVFYVGSTRARKALFVAPLVEYKSFLEEVIAYAPICQSA
ncbi:UvrD-helicase domain-containing protein [Archaeoglobus profundus]|uniref:UvrD-helicase domain-containing protein n=1 Tax=Archaeoglobus profundus TaxID=84156 RepID=UPI000AC927FA|nr:ATP-dependent helicase [Archaeoglobus profundus]